MFKLTERYKPFGIDIFSNEKLPDGTILMVSGPVPDDCIKDIRITGDGQKIKFHEDKFKKWADTHVTRIVNIGQK